MSPNDQVTKTYSVGLRFEGETRSTRRKSEIFANTIVRQYQEELYQKLTTERVDRGLEFIRNTEKPLSGVQGSAILRKELNDLTNLGESAYLPLLTSINGVLDREQKIQFFLDFLGQYPTEGYCWLLFGRSPFAEFALSKKIKTDYSYARNLIQGARRTFNLHLLGQFPFLEDFPVLTPDQVLTAFEKFYQEKRQVLLQLENRNKAQDQFLKKLNFLYSQKVQVSVFLSQWNLVNPEDPKTLQKSSWKRLKYCAKQANAEFLPGKKVKASYFFSLLRGILVSAFIPVLEQEQQITVNQLLETGLLQAKHLVSKPYVNKRPKHQQRLPLQLLMGSRYIVGRPGNNQELTQLIKENAEFQLEFWPYRKRDQSFKATLRCHQVLHQFFQNGAQVDLLILEAGDAPAEKLQVRLVCSGERWMFYSKKSFNSLSNDLSQDLTVFSSLGIDVNRISKYFLAYSDPITFPDFLLTQIKRYLHLREVLRQLQRGIQRRRRVYDQNSSLQMKQRFLKVYGEFLRVHDRQQRLRASIHREARIFTVSILCQRNYRAFAVENLKLSTRGTKGALARAISSIPETDAFFESIWVQTNWLRKDPLELHVFPAYYTSQAQHLNCFSNPAGKLKRVANNWDLAECTHCHKQENSHIHAARVIQSRIDDPG